ncbi:hypothetical protein A4U53_000610 (plasmid) [Rhizobium ruizarguesonis]|uniref:Uncharacterized protein n=1 Tax=Rhizobium ruizarguesonis TaxID=2081791 RepID=A0ACD5EF76_9HYPH
MTALDEDKICAIGRSFSASDLAILGWKPAIAKGRVTPWPAAEEKHLNAFRGVIELGRYIEFTTRLWEGTGHRYAPDGKAKVSAFPNSRAPRFKRRQAFVRIKEVTDMRDGIFAKPKN